MSIGYIAQVFPSLSMTFVYREVAALRSAGFEVQTFSTWKPKLSELSDEAKYLVQDTFYIFPLNWLQFLVSHFKYIVTRPQRYWGTLLFCLTRPHKTLKNRLRTFLHFCQAVHLARAVEQKGVNHLHAHFALNAATIALVVSRLTNTTFSFTVHANDIFVNPILLPEKIQAAEFIVSISEYNIRFLQKIVSPSEVVDKTHLVHCGIDVEHFMVSNNEKPDTGPPLIFSVARLVEKKGFFYLIKACKILVERGYEFNCLIGGDGPEYELLERLIQENGLTDCVKLLGVVFQEELKDYLNKTDIFVLPCIKAEDEDMDGIPNSLMEAMAMEIPVISTTLSGIPELIEDHRTGLLVPPNDETALANAICTLLDDANLGHILGQAGRVKVAEEFEIEKNAKSLLKIFEKYLPRAKESSINVT